MNTYRYDKEQRQNWVSEKYNGTKSVKKICKEAGISRATLYNWLNEFPEIKAAAAERESEEALAPPAPVVYYKHGITGKYEMLLSALSQVDATGLVKKKMVQALVKRFTLTVPQACDIVGLEESMYDYRPRKPEEEDKIVYDEISRILEEDGTRGFIDCYHILQQLHPGWPRKQIKRLWGEKRLYLQRSVVRRRSIRKPVETDARISRPNASWNLGYLSFPIDHQPAWALFILDEQDGQPLNMITGWGEATSEHITNFLSLAEEENGKPRKIRIPGKAPLNSREVTVWLWENKVALQSLSMGKPENMAATEEMENRVIAQLLQDKSIPTLQALRQAIETWLRPLSVLI